MDEPKLGEMLPSGIRAQDSSAGRPWGKSIIYGKDGDHDTPYMTRWWIGRLRLHTFHRGDQDPDHHDHPWGFWTFPLTSYVEEVLETGDLDHDLTLTDGDMEYLGIRVYRRVVKAFRLHYRPAHHTHRVLGRWAGHSPVMEEEVWIATEEAFHAALSGLAATDGRIVTLVWRDKADRAWGFWKLRDKKLCWSPWREYVFGKGKSAPCQ